VHWPAGIKAKGELRTQVGHLIDIMPTCVEIGGATCPTQFKGKPILPMEGKSLLGTFSNQPIAREALFWEHEDNAAVRVGDMKLVRVRGKAWELYDMAKDRTELHDLANERFHVVQSLAAKWEAGAFRAHVKAHPQRGGKQGKGKKEAANDDDANKE
jgi:arylsulfatase